MSSSSSLLSPAEIFEQINNGGEEGEALMKEYTATLSSKDLLGTAALLKGQWSASKSFSAEVSKISLAGKSGKENASFRNSVKVALCGVTKGGIDPMFDGIFEQDSHNRFKMLIDNIIYRAENNIREIEANKSKKKDTPSSVDEDIASVVKEITWVRYLLDKFGAKAFVREDVIPLFKPLKVLQAMKVTAQVRDEKLLEYLQNKVNDEKLLSKIDEWRIKPGQANIGEIQAIYGVNDVGAAILQEIEMVKGHVTYEYLIKLRDVLDNFYIDYSQLHEEGFAGVVSDYKSKCNDFSRVRTELIGIDETMESAIPDIHIFWRFLEKLNHSSDKNPTLASSTCNTAMQFAITSAYDSAKMTSRNSKGVIQSLDTRMKLLENSLASIDAKTSYSKEKTKTPILNTQIKPRKTTKGGGGRKTMMLRGKCINVLRHGYCENKQCGFQGVTQNEWNQRGQCDADAVGSCHRQFCPFLHKSDPKGPDLSRCVHNQSHQGGKQKGQINSVSLSDLDVSSMKEGEVILLTGTVTNGGGVSVRPIAKGAAEEDQPSM